MKHLSTVLFVVFTSLMTSASGGQGIYALERRQALLDLTTSFRLLCVAAHPDDEDGAVLAYYRKGRGVRTAVCYVTSGEGGQNAAGPELRDELRVVRMKEAEAAARVLGSRSFYLHMPDFGYTRSLTETLEKWGAEKAKEGLVRVIRRFRPHVVLYRSAVTPRSHGHHQATFKLLKEAILEASDRTRFEDHLQELLYPWRVSRLFHRCQKVGATVGIDVGARDSFLGASYAEIGDRARVCHRSQGYRLHKAGELPGTLYYRLVSLPGREKKESADDFFSDLVANGPEELELKKEADYRRAHEVDLKICKAGEDALKRGLVDPETVTLLMEAQKSISELSMDPFAERKLQRGEWFEEIGYQHFFRHRVNEINQALRQVLNIAVSVDADRRGRACDEELDVVVKVTMDSDRKIEGVIVVLEEADRFIKTYCDQKNRTLTRDKPVHAYFKARVKEKARPTVPEAPHYRRVEEFLPGMRCTISGRIDGEIMAFVVGIDMPDIVAPVQIKSHPTRLVKRLEAAAEGVPVWVEFRTQGPLYFLGGRPRQKPPRFKPRKKPLRFRLWPEGTEGLHIKPSSVIIEDWTGEKTSFHRFKIRSDAPLRGGAISFHAQLLEENNEKKTRGPVFTVKLPVDIIDSKVSPGTQVGVIAGHDRPLVMALKALGIRAKVLEASQEEALVFLDSAHDFKTLFIGWRALEALPGLKKYHKQLEEFVKNGGRIVFLGQRPGAWNEDRGNPRMVPFPLNLGKGRIEDEDALVKILEPDHPIFTEPNRIGPEDFKGWIQERGLHFPYEADAGYTRLLSIDRGGKNALDTGLLVAGHGKGTVVYVALALSRQLEGAVPGAYELLANLASPGIHEKR